MTNIIDLTQKRKEKLLKRIDALAGLPYVGWSHYTHLNAARLHVFDDELPIAKLIIDEVENSIKTFRRMDGKDPFALPPKFFQYIEPTIKDDNE